LFAYRVSDCQALKAGNRAFANIQTGILHTGGRILSDSKRQLRILRAGIIRADWVGVSEGQAAAVSRNAGCGN
jgi:hypothetical protein